MRESEGKSGVQSIPEYNTEGNLLNEICCFFGGHSWDYDVPKDWAYGKWRKQRICRHCGKSEVSAPMG